MKAQIKLIEQELLTEVTSKTLPGFVNDAEPEMIYTKTYNNLWDMTFGYMTSCLKLEAMRDWYSNGVQNKKAQVKFDDEHRKKCKEGLHSLSNVMDQRVCYTCIGKEPHACSSPNAKKAPDVVMEILPGNCAKYLKIPVFIFKVLGLKKEKWKNELQFPGYITAMQCLAFALYCYYGEVTGDTVSLYKLQKDLEYGKIDIIKEQFQFGLRSELEIVEAFRSLIEKLTLVFFDIYFNLSWVHHESSRLLKIANFHDFIASLDGHRQPIEKHCWHIFEPLYMCHDKYDPLEYDPALDMEDPARVEFQLHFNDRSKGPPPYKPNEFPIWLLGDEALAIFPAEYTQEKRDSELRRKMLKQREELETTDATGKRVVLP